MNNKERLNVFKKVLGLIGSQKDTKPEFEKVFRDNFRKLLVNSSLPETPLLENQRVNTCSICLDICQGECCPECIKKIKQNTTETMKEQGLL